MTKGTRTTIFIFTLVAALIVVFFVAKRAALAPQKEPAPITKVEEPLPEPLPPEEPKVNAYTSLVLSSTTPMKELEEAVGKEDVDTVLRINRIDERFLAQNMTLTIPTDMSDYMALSPFPGTIPLIQSVPKLLFISQEMQAFGAYENGVLVRWGPVSSGKKSTPTPSKLFFANWKGKEVISTANDEWILKWNFNLDNFNGIGMHLYEMPGHPASHSCVRLLEADALFLYDWTEQWILAKDGQTLRAHGTPVLVFGAYNFDTTAPWKKLPDDETATTLSIETLETEIAPSLPLIEKRAAERAAITQPVVPVAPEKETQ